MSDVQAVILAGGEGSRLRPLTKNRPKVMIPVGNRPIIEHVIDAVVKAGIRDITVVLGYKREQVMTFLNKYPLEINVAFQDKQLGTAHALSCAKEFIHKKTVVLPGDNYVDVESIKQMAQAENAILVSHHKNPENFGLVNHDDGFLTKITENPKFADESDLICCSVYTLSPKHIKDIKFNNMSDLMNSLVGSREKFSLVYTDKWQDAVYPKDLLVLNENLLSDLKTIKGGVIDKSAKITGNVVIGENTIIGVNCVIEGPAVIGNGCRIEPNVYIGRSTSIGSGVSVEPFTFIKNSVIMDNSSVGSHSRVADSVIGEGCVLKDHVSTVNTGVGAVLGDRVSVGPFTVLKGCSIGDNVNILGGRFIERDIPEDSRVI